MQSVRLELTTNVLKGRCSTKLSYDCFKRVIEQLTPHLDHSAISVPTKWKGDDISAIYTPLCCIFKIRDLIQITVATSQPYRYGSRMLFLSAHLDLLGQSWPSRLFDDPDAWNQIIVGWQYQLEENHNTTYITQISPKSKEKSRISFKISWISLFSILRDLSCSKEMASRHDQTCSQTSTLFLKLERDHWRHQWSIPASWRRFAVLSPAEATWREDIVPRNLVSPAHDFASRILRFLDRSSLPASAERHSRWCFS